jgi:hypothetical protein
MIEKECEDLRKGQLVYFSLDNMIGMIIDIDEHINDEYPNVKVEWFIDDKIVIGNITKRVARYRRKDYIDMFI